MREIKFRAWDVTDEKMFKPDGFSFEMGISAITVKEVGKLINPNEMSNTYKIMQYTDLKDKNGVEIFEGDILGSFGKKRRVEVFWRGGAKGWTVRPVRGELRGQAFSPVPPISQYAAHSKVIGNIYENPELLT